MYCIGDVVELIADLPESKWSAGCQATVVEIYDHGRAYEVEFTDQFGTTLDFRAVPANQLICVWQSENHRPVPSTDQMMELLSKLPEQAIAEILNFARSTAFRLTHQDKVALPGTH